MSTTPQPEEPMGIGIAAGAAAAQAAPMHVSAVSHPVSVIYLSQHLMYTVLCFI